MSGFRVPATPSESGSAIEIDRDDVNESLKRKLIRFKQFDLTMDERKAFDAWKQRQSERDRQKSFFEGQRSILSVAQKTIDKNQKATRDHLRQLPRRNQGGLKKMSRAQVERHVELTTDEIEQMTKFIDLRLELSRERIKWIMCANHEFVPCKKILTEASFLCGGPMCEGHCKHCGNPAPQKAL